MAAIDLERGLEHRGRGWGQERPELMDNFDSEMQEWEDQLQDIQRKIEELYTEVQARRGTNDISGDNQKNGVDLDCGLGNHGSGLFVPGHQSKNHTGTMPVPHHYSNDCNYKPNVYSYPVNHQNGYGYCHTNGVSEIGDLLQDYLGAGKMIHRKSNKDRHVHFSDTVKVSPLHKEETKRSHENNRHEGSFEETENRKNQLAHMKNSPHREGSPNKESTGAKPPLGQRDSPVAQSRSQLPGTTTESPALDRKSFSPGVLGDRLCSSPSVLRKFGAMLQENEGKTLTETGVVTQQAPTLEPKCPTPSCQRRALGAAAVASRAAARMPAHKCQADCDVMTAELEPCQEWALVSDAGRQHHKDHRGIYNSSKGPQASPQQSQRRSQVPGSPKVRPRTNSLTDRDGGRKSAPQHVEPKMDYRVSSVSSGAQKTHRGGLAGQELPDSTQVRDEGLIELLDMLDIQHEFSFSPKTSSTAFRQESQLTNPEMSPVKPKRSFSRPARPANQRPPSRWASRTPTARIAAPSGPMCRPPSPMTRSPSPALKHSPPISYSLQTETVIM